MLQYTQFNPFQLSVAFHIKTSHFNCKSNQVTGFYMKCNTGLRKYIKGSESKTFKIAEIYEYI